MRTTILLLRTVNRARLILATWLCLSALFALGARGAVFSAYERTNTLGANDLFLVAAGSNNAYVTRTVTFSNLVGNVAGLTNAAVKLRVGNTKLTLATNSATLQARGGSSVLLGGNLITLLDSNAVPRLEVAANTTAIYAPNGTLAEVITADGTAYFATNVFITNGVLHLGSASLVLSNSPVNTVFYEGGVAVIDLRPNAVTIATNLIVTGTLTGNGAGLTNLLQAASSSASSTNLGLTGYVTNGDYSTMIGYGVGAGTSAVQNATFIGANSGRAAPVTQSWYVTDYTVFNQTPFSSVESALAAMPPESGYAYAFDPTIDVAAFFTYENLGPGQGDLGVVVGMVANQFFARASYDVGAETFTLQVRGSVSEDSGQYQNFPMPAAPWQGTNWAGIAAQIAVDHPGGFAGWSPLPVHDAVLTNAIAIGHNARVSDSSTAQIGGTGVDAVSLVVNSNGTFGGSLTASNGTFGGNLTATGTVTANAVTANAVTANTVTVGGFSTFTSGINAGAVMASAFSGGTLNVANAYAAGFTASSYYYGPQTYYTTNLPYPTATPNMAQGYALMATNAAFTVQPPTGVDNKMKFVQTHVLFVTNTTAAYIAITPPGGGVKSSGTWAVTNLSEITTTVYPRLVTNMVCLPMF